jgi:hypothetical protein
LKINKLIYDCVEHAFDSVGLAIVCDSQWRNFHPHLGMTLQANVPIWERLVDGAPSCLGVSSVSNHMVE